MPRKLSPLKSLAKLLDAAAAPIYLLDSARQFVYGNAAFTAWVGRPAEDLIGLKCHYHSSGQITGLAELGAALCPTPDAFSGQLQTGMVAAPGPDGGLVPRPASFVPLTVEGHDPAGVLVIVGEAADGEPGGAAASSGELTSAELHTELQRLRGDLGRRYQIGQLIGQSNAIIRVRDQVRLATQSHARVLVLGPPGSGREHVARTIHYGPPGAGPLVPVTCKLVDAELMQAAITSALKRPSDNAASRPATLLLQDVDQLPADAQHELAGFLRLPNLELALLSTAGRPLQKLAERGKFRPDLAYFLSTLTIKLPALANRPEDIPLLAQFFLEEQNANGGKQLAGFKAEALDLLAAYHWPGNVEELLAIVREASAQAAGPRVAAADLPPRLHHAASAGARAQPPAQPIHLDDFLAQIETELLRRALEQARDNKTQAALLLGIHRARLIRRLVQLGLTPPTPDDEPVIFEPLDPPGGEK